MRRRDFFQQMLRASPLVLTGCALPSVIQVRPSGLVFVPTTGGIGSGAPFQTGREARPTSSLVTMSGGRRAAALRDYQQGFAVSGAFFRFAPKPSYGMAWTAELQRGYQSIKHDSRVSYAVKNLATGAYLAEQQADRIMTGCSMPKPAVSATLLEARGGHLNATEYQHIVNACDLSVNESWKALLARFSDADEQAFEAKYRLPDVPLRANAQSARYYAEFFERCVNYRLDHGCELLLEAMRRNQFGRGRWYLPAEITYVGGKTGTDGQFKHEGLFFYYRGTPYAIVLYTNGRFGREENFWRIGAMFGGLFREYIA